VPRIFEKNFFRRAKFFARALVISASRCQRVRATPSAQDWLLRKAASLQGSVRVAA